MNRGAEFFQARRIARRPRQDADILAAAHAGLGNVTADKPRCPGDQITHA